MDILEREVTEEDLRQYRERAHEVARRWFRRASRASLVRILGASALTGAGLVVAMRVPGIGWRIGFTLAATGGVLGWVACAGWLHARRDRRRAITSALEAPWGGWRVQELVLRPLRLLRVPDAISTRHWLIVIEHEVCCGCERDALGWVSREELPRWMGA